MITFDIFFGVMGGRSILMGNRQPVFNGISGGRVVFRIVDFFVYNGLNRRILSGINRQAAAVKHVVGLGVCIT